MSLVAHGDKMEETKIFHPQSLTVSSEVLSKLYTDFRNLKDRKDSYEKQMRDSTRSVEYRAIARDNFLKSEAFLMGVEHITREIGLIFEEENIEVIDEPAGS